MKKKPTPPAKPITKLAVAVDRPVATVTITLDGVDHKLTEEEARALHGRLTSVLNISPPAPLPQRPPYIPRDIPRWEPRYISPPPDPWWKDKIMCLASGGDLP